MKPEGKARKGGKGQTYEGGGRAHHKREPTRMTLVISVSPHSQGEEDSMRHASSSTCEHVCAVGASSGPGMKEAPPQTAAAPGEPEVAGQSG